MKYRLFLWSTLCPHNTAQGCMDFPTLETATAAYRFFFDLAMGGESGITCMDLYPIDENDDLGESIYTATFPA